MLPTVKKSIHKGLIRVERVGQKVIGIVGVLVATTLAPGVATAAGIEVNSTTHVSQDAPVLLIPVTDLDGDGCFRGHRSHYSHRSHRSHHSHYSSRR